jgi:hypothetical protein
MHPSTNVFVDLNEFIKKHNTLQDITLQGLSKKNHTNNTHIMNLLMSSLLEWKISKTFNINKYQLLFVSTFYLMDFKTYEQTFYHLIINLKQPFNDLRIKMHNKYVM